MKVEILRGSKLKSPEKNIVPNYENELPETNEGPNLLTRLGLSLVGGFEAPGHALDALLRTIGEPPLLQGSLVEDISNKLGYRPEQSLPQSLPESYAQRFLKQAPTALAVGPANALRNLAIGSGTATGLQAAGQPEFIQDIGQLGTEIGLGALQGTIPTLGSKQKQAYSQARELVPAGESHAGTTVISGINKAREALKTETNEKVVSKINHAINTIENNLDNISSKLNPKTAMDLRRKLYRNVKNLPQDAKEYSKILTSSINDFFADYSARNPKFYNELSKADQYTMLKNMNSYLGDTFGSLASKIIPSGYPGAQSFTRELFKNITGNTAGEFEKITRRILKSPLAREHYFDVVKSVNNPQLLVKNLDQLEQILAAEDIGIPVEQKPKVKVKVLRGQKIS